MRQGIYEAEARAEQYELETFEASQVLLRVVKVLERIKTRTKTSKLLADLRPARRRWELVCSDTQPALPIHEIRYASWSTVTPPGARLRLLEYGSESLAYPRTERMREMIV